MEIGIQNFTGLDKVQSLNRSFKILYCKTQVTTIWMETNKYTWTDTLSLVPWFPFTYPNRFVNHVPTL